MNFSLQRTAGQAFGWYIVFLVIGFVLGGVAGFFAALGATDFHTGYMKGAIAGRIVAPIYIITLSILVSRSRPKDIYNISLVLGGIFLSLLLSSLGELIPLAILTTRAPEI